MKKCKDNKCTRAGQRLRLGEFPRDRRANDQRYVYCKECCRRRTKALRAANGRPEYRRRGFRVERKPMVLSPQVTAFSLVYDAINKGCRTRESIRRETKLDWDSIGDALLELIWDCKAVRIQGRKLLLVDVCLGEGNEKKVA